MVEIGLTWLIEDGLEAEMELFEENRYRTLLIRQSAFFEEFLVVVCRTAFQDLAGRVLSNEEMQLIDQMGHQDRTRLAYLLGSITEEQHGYLQQLVTAGISNRR